MVDGLVVVRRRVDENTILTVVDAAEKVPRSQGLDSSDAPKSDHKTAFKNIYRRRPENRKSETPEEAEKRLQNEKRLSEEINRMQAEVVEVPPANDNLIENFEGKTYPEIEHAIAYTKSTQKRKWFKERFCQETRRRQQQKHLQETNKNKDGSSVGDELTKWFEEKIVPRQKAFLSAKMEDKFAPDQKAVIQNPDYAQIHEFDDSDDKKIDVSAEHATVATPVTPLEEAEKAELQAYELVHSDKRLKLAYCEWCRRQRIQEQVESVEHIILENLELLRRFVSEVGLYNKFQKYCDRKKEHNVRFENLRGARAEDFIKKFVKVFHDCEGEGPDLFRSLLADVEKEKSGKRKLLLEEAHRKKAFLKWFEKHDKGADFTEDDPNVQDVFLLFYQVLYQNYERLHVDETGLKEAYIQWCEECEGKGIVPDEAVENLEQIDQFMSDYDGYGKKQYEVQENLL